MKKYFPILTILVILSSCTAESDGLFPGVSEKLGGKTIFHATTEATSTPETKTYADQSMRVLWNEGDQVTIFNKITYNHGFEFNGDDGDTAGSFIKFTPEPSEFSTWEDIPYNYAVYPYSTGNKCGYDGNLTVMLPAEQPYKDNSFGIGANTMVAVSDDIRLQFKNVGGYLSLRLYGDGVRVSSVKIEGNAGEKIAGKAFVTIPMGGTPTTVMDETANESITIVCDPAVQLGADAEHYTDFWFVIPPVTFSEGFRITVTDDQGGVFEKTTTNSLTVTRNQLDWMNPLEVIPGAVAGNVEFADANFKAYCVDNFDTNGNGEISLSEAAAVTVMNVYTDHIASLNGIESFTNLQSLVCHPNASGHSGQFGYTFVNQYGEEVIGQLTTLDLSMNTKLQHLNCQANQLASLNVSNCTALTYLNCAFNQITSLDLSSCAALEEIYCRYAGLTSLDVSDLTSLRKLECEFNQLTSLDVSNCSALSHLDCYYDQLSLLDISSCTALTDLICFNNQLTSLDVSNNIDLYNLQCENNPYLREIWLYRGQTIESFIYDSDVAIIKRIGDLYDDFPDGYFRAYVFQNFDTDRNGVLSQSECNAVTRISVCTDSIYSVKGIEYFPNLETLYCRGSYPHHHMTTGQLTSLDVSHNTALAILECGCNRIQSLDVSNNPALQYFECDDNIIESLDFSNNPELKTIICTLNCLSSLDVSGCTKLEILRCDENPPFELDLSGLNALTELSFGGPDTQSFYPSSNYQECKLNLSGCISLKNLCVFGGTISNLSDCTALESLSIEFGADSSLVLLNNTAIKRICCSSSFNLTTVNVSGCSALEYIEIDTYTTNSLTSLDVSGCSSLTGLYCCDNQLTELDVSNNLALTRLNCSGNQLATLDVSNNLALASLDCTDNPMATLYLKTGQTISTLNKPDTTVIEYK